MIEVVHRHWFYLFKEVIAFGMVAFVPLIAVILFYGFGLGAYVVIPGSPGLLFAAFMCAWFLLIAPMVMVVWTDYHLDMLLITNRRIIAIEQKGLFAREISSFRYERIQDITIEIHGIIATLLDFGDIHIQTAGDNRDFLITYIPKPQRVKDCAFKEYNRTFARMGAV